MMRCLVRIEGPGCVTKHSDPFALVTGGDPAAGTLRLVLHQSHVDGVSLLFGAPLNVPPCVSFWMRSSKTACYALINLAELSHKPALSSESMVVHSRRFCPHPINVSPLLQFPTRKHYLRDITHCLSSECVLTALFLLKDTLFIVRPRPCVVSGTHNALDCGLLKGSAL